MQELTSRVTRALAELEEWESRDRETNAPFATSCRQLLLQAERASTLDELDQRAATLLRVIADSGPLSADFLPSFQEVAQALEKRRRAGHGSPTSRRT
jgi:hypothetical protein